MRKIIDYLRRLGLSEIEIRIYQALLEIGPSTVLKLADYTGIKRITVHFNIENLIKKGLVSQIKEGGRRRLIAEPPEVLKYLIETKEEEITKLKNEFPEILAYFYNNIPHLKHPNKVEVRYFEGENGVRLIYKEVLKAKELRSYVNISMIYKLFPENPQLFPKILRKNNLKMWEIIEDSPLSREYVRTTNPKKYLYKFFPKSFDQTVFFDYMIFDGKVAIITAEENVPLGILIDHPYIYNNSKFIFDMIWSLLPSPK